jgi:hypothetical protein
MSTKAVLDSGDRREFGTGAVRDMASGKGRFDLVMWSAVWDLAKYIEVSSKKYPEDNWRKGITCKSFLDSAIRHLIKLAMGMDDEDHWAGAYWNLSCLRETQHMVRLGKLARYHEVPDEKNPGKTKTVDLLDLPQWFYGVTVNNLNQMVSSIMQDVTQDIPKVLGNAVDMPPFTIDLSDPLLNAPFEFSTMSFTGDCSMEGFSANVNLASEQAAQQDDAKSMAPPVTVEESGTPEPTFNKYPKNPTPEGTAEYADAFGAKQEVTPPHLIYHNDPMGVDDDPDRNVLVSKLILLAEGSPDLPAVDVALELLGGNDVAMTGPDDVTTSMMSNLRAISDGLKIGDEINERHYAEDDKYIEELEAFVWAPWWKRLWRLLFWSRPVDPAYTREEEAMNLTT